MSAKVRVIPQEVWEKIKEFFDDGEYNNGIVLIPEEVAKQVQTGKDIDLKKIDGETIDYDFGGDPDLYVDVVLSLGHCFVDYLKNRDEGDSF